jgi:hypothetical protein
MRTMISLFMLGLSSLVFAQTTDYNTKTLALFNDENWDNLIEICKKAIGKNKSSYEIEYRLAVAYYNSNKYFESANQFENIQEIYNINNDYIQEYLYYSYQFSGRERDALLISKNFPFHLKQKIEIKNFQFIDHLNSEGGIKLSSRRDIDIENISYFNVGLGQKLGYHLILNHAYTSLSQNYIDFDYKQKEYYLNANIHVATGLTLIPAYHYVNINENTASMTRRRQSSMMSSRANNEKINLLHFALKKQWNRFSIMPNVTYSSAKLIVDNIEQETTNKMQYGLDIGYTINGLKDKLWLGFGANILNDNSENEFIWNVKAHYQINPKIFFLMKYLNANTSNFSEDNAMYYYNSVSILVDKFSATFGYHFSPEFSWFMNYQFENAEDVENDFLFTYNTFITGLKYDF